MKYNSIYTKLFGWFAAAVLLLTTSCSDDLFGDPNGNSDEVTVSFTLSTEAATRTRSEEGHVDYNNWHISDGTKADMLVYAVYDENDSLLLGYGDGVIDNEDGTLAGQNITNGEGQTIMAVDKFPITVNLTLKRGAKYRIAFWAQSSQTKAYDYSDLRKVEMKYTEIGRVENGDELKTTTPNNDEYRDAFCRSVEIIAGESNGVEQNIYLYRPLAQINVGTSGYDYELATRKATKKYTYSKIRINRVPRYLNVVDDEILTTTISSDKSESTQEAFAVVDYGYAPIAAYANPACNIPQYPSYTTWDEKYSPGFNYPVENWQEVYGKEEFLKVQLNYNTEGGSSFEDIEMDRNGQLYTLADESGYRGYANYELYNSHDMKDISSETFKYLSMCYVLTASDKDTRDVINNVRVWMATDAAGSDSINILDINSVPAQRNWRTNIVGNLLTRNEVFAVKLDRNFAGEYYNWDGQWSGYLADGVYYDEGSDEIQISNASGLIWLQKMVNGKLKVRESYDYNSTTNAAYNSVGVKAAKVGENYYFYDENDKPKQLQYIPIEKPTDNQLLERILRATHHRTENGDLKPWPENGQFHFCGDNPKDRAKVRLMADIDLTGVQWIPIGFDGRIKETVDKDFEASEPTNRGFFGIFNGNGRSITNLNIKRFSACVHDKHQQIEQSGVRGPYDNPQWFARGLFGEIGGYAEIRNVKLINPDVYGCQCVGAIVGAAHGQAIKIKNCIVEGGTLTVTPMYRGDSHKMTGDAINGTGDRTFARGVYLGGIVGYFYTQKGELDSCEVRNTYMRGYRRVGGIIGSVNQNDLGDGTKENKTLDSDPYSISYNKITNTVIVASQFSTFGMARWKQYFYPNKDGDIVKTGFAWNEKPDYHLYAHKFVGGHDKELNDWNNKVKWVGNQESGVTLAEFNITHNGTELGDDGKSVNATERTAELHASPLKYLPALSSWYADVVNLNANYYGEPSAYKIQKLHRFNVRMPYAAQTGYAADGGFSNGYIMPSRSSYKNTEFLFPMRLPYVTEIDWDETSPRVGVYVESVTLDGSKNPVGGRSVITPIGVSGKGACAMYITARNRYQFDNKIRTSDGLATFKVPTIVKKVVVRGDPYAYTGILLAPNKNMNEVRLEEVAVYDVYQTIACDDWSDVTDAFKWPSSSTVQNCAGNLVPLGKTTAKLTVTGCNLRGYTVPGENWAQISYSGTTFEIGSYTGHGDLEKTCKVDAAPTTFTGCYFKAPYIIDLTNATNVTFENCWATAASPQNTRLNVPAGCKKIVIESDSQGRPKVTYQ